MLFSIDYVNNLMSKTGHWIPGVRLGAHILDDCDKDTYGLEQAVDFIKGNVIILKPCKFSFFDILGFLLQLKTCDAIFSCEYEVVSISKFLLYGRVAAWPQIELHPTLIVAAWQHGPNP